LRRAFRFNSRETGDDGSDSGSRKGGFRRFRS
jgi:hypothetical protein